MLLESEKNSNVELKDAEGNVLLYVKTFDTVSKEATVYARICYKNDTSSRQALLGTSIFGSGKSIVTFNCHLVGVNAYDKETGNLIK
jgi:hypothetical protein